MDMTQIDEQWIEIPKAMKTRGKNSIVAISNTGKYRRSDGTIGILELRHSVRSYGTLKRCSRIIAENFLTTVRRPDQVFVDHITHNTTEYNLNDVRNLRWCTKAENSRFEEARENMSKAKEGESNHMYGRTGEKAPMYGSTCDKNPNWKGDSAKPCAKHRRALRNYRRNPTEENLAALKEARLKWNEWKRLRRAKG